MKYTILTLIWSLFVVNISAQQYSNKFEFKIGTGIVLIEKGTYNSSFENEIGYKLNKLLAASMAISTGRSFDSSVEHNDYLQGGLNIFISPWKNINRNNFKLGIGYALMNRSKTNLHNIFEESKYCKEYIYTSNVVNGINFILENDYKINSLFTAGGKIYLGMFERSDLTYGAMLHFGIAL
ncbi:MAG: hypothetical protein QMB99_03490 [Paludibacteraceae bacterium]|jgi:hypothetical protein